MALYHKWDVKTGFTFALQFFMLISEGLGGVDWAIVSSNTDIRLNENGLELRTKQFETYSWLLTQSLILGGKLALQIAH